MRKKVKDGEGSPLNMFIDWIFIIIVGAACTAVLAVDDVGLTALLLVVAGLIYLVQFAYPRFEGQFEKVTVAIFAVIFRRSKKKKENSETWGKIIASAPCLLVLAAIAIGGYFGDVAAVNYLFGTANWIVIVPLFSLVIVGLFFKKKEVKN